MTQHSSDITHMNCLVFFSYEGSE